jgi:glutamate N-acetyltransferase/amino-acid N-acetyltransferase
MKGFQFNGIAAGIKTNGKKDLGIIYSERPASAAALFTTNKVVAAPVILGRERIIPGICQAVVVNSGNANCFTGEQGYKDAVETARVAASQLNIPEDLVMVSSTGVIGAPLSMEKMHTGIPLVVADMAADKADDFAQAILTTDLAKKMVNKTCTIKGKAFSVCGFAKGSGMIRPNMATMLAFVCTDVDISSNLLKTVLQKACDTSFNRISVDGDTSTNDMVIAMANGMSGTVLEDSDDALEFQRVMDETLLELSKMIVRDGEGATKLARIVVRGAASSHDAFLTAEAIAHSNLVKTALYGEDPNWGRITAAAGRSGAMVYPDKMDLFFGEVPLIIGGVWQGVDAEKEAARVMKADELEMILDLNLGDYSDFFIFCDFSEDYVKINADYRS